MLNNLPKPVQVASDKMQIGTQLCLIVSSVPGPPQARAKVRLPGKASWSSYLHCDGPQDGWVEGHPLPFVSTAQVAKGRAWPCPFFLSWTLSPPSRLSFLP